MRKFLFILFALLFCVGVASAANIPSVVNPTEGPELWITQVYNNSGGTLDVGDVVIWQIGSSTGDDDNYVTTTTTAQTYIVAGVVWPVDIGATNSGTIVIRGPVAVDDDGRGLNDAGGLACTSGTAGAATSCTSAPQANFGIVTQAGASGSAIVFVNP